MIFAAERCHVIQCNVAALKAAKLGSGVDLTIKSPGNCLKSNTEIKVLYITKYEELIFGNNLPIPPTVICNATYICVCVCV